MEGSTLEKIFTKIAVWTFVLVFAWAVVSTGLLCYTSRQYNKLGESDNELRRQLVDATDTNTRLADEIRGCRDQLEECRSVTAALGDTAGRSITTAREAIEVCEQLREEVAVLQSVFDSDWQSDYYNYWDSNLGLE